MKIKTLIISCVVIFSGCSHNNQVNSDVKAVSTIDNNNEQFVMLLGGTEVGTMTVAHDNAQLAIDFGFSNNGRGASSTETITLNDEGIPVNWQVSGKTVFGNAVEESFSVDGNEASWTSSSESGSGSFTDEPMYISQYASPYAVYLYAKPLLEAKQASYPALPAGKVQVDARQTLTLQSADGSESRPVTFYALGGISMNPSYFVADDNNQLIALVSPRYAVIQPQFVNEEKRLRELSGTLNAQRYQDIAEAKTHQYDKPVRINNVRIFQPQEQKLSFLQSVVIKGNVIQSVGPVAMKPKSGEVTIDGAGGTLIAGLYEMHGHIGDNDALLNVLAGVTSVRDMGNEIDVLDQLVNNINSGKLVGPRITRSGLIEGASPFSNSTGELAKTEEEAVALVNMYADRGDYYQIKIYSSVKGEWVPAMAEAAHNAGLRVAGHVPAFSTADEMIAAGYDEITHINQLMLGWVLAKDEDTRTLFRITGMKRFVDLDLNSDAVQHTLNVMAQNGIAIDPTTVIHETAMTSRNGSVREGVKDYIDHMPIDSQRSARVAMLNVADDAEDKAYLAAYKKIIDTLTLMHEKGILIVPGTDMGGAFNLHRELELFQQFGMTPAEVLKRGTYDMANYLGQGDKLGSIEPGKLADFFLVPGNPTKDLKAIKKVSMAVSDGKIFFPSEIYPAFGITPFTEAPVVYQ